MRAFVGSLMFVVSAAMFAPAAPVPKHLMKPASAAGIEGTWKVESMQRGAKAFQLPRGGQTMQFGGAILTVTSDPGTENEIVTTAIAAHDAQRRQIFTTQHTDLAGRIVNPNVAYGYKLDGDKLTLATRQGVNLAFNALDPKDAGETDVVLVLTRVKK